VGWLHGVVTRVTTPITSSSRICPARQAAAWAAESPTCVGAWEWREKGGEQVTHAHRKRSCEAGLRCYVSATLPASPPPLLWSKSPHRSGHHSIRVSSTPSRSAPPVPRDADAPQAAAGRAQAPLLRRGRRVPGGGPVSRQLLVLPPSPASFLSPFCVSLGFAQAHRVV
jgi:hypothetical protein